MQEKQGLGLFKLTCFAIGTTLASGVFSMFSDMAANGAGTLSVLIGWTIAGAGMYSLAMCFNRLSIVRPNLKSGIFTYAREGFGPYTGFNSAWGYWISAILSQVSFATLLFAALGQFIPLFGDGNNLASIIGASILVWAFTLGAFDLDIFLENFLGEDTGYSLGKQVLETTYTTVWIFTGIEGAVVISGRAKSTAIAGKATTLSFLSLLVLYVLISILSMGIMPRSELANLEDPAMAVLLSHVVGPWGATLINIGVIISIAGAMFSYTIVTAENGRHAPIGALLLTAAIIQVLLIIVYFQSSTYQALYTLATSAIMIPFVLSALYCLKTCFEDRRFGHNPVSFKAWLISILGVIYGFWMLYATGISNVVISAMMFAPGALFYLWSRLQNREKIFEGPLDIAAFIVIAAGLLISMLH